MSNAKKLEKDKTVHASVAGKPRALCTGKKSSRTTTDPAEVTCLPCARKAAQVMDGLAADLEAAEAAGRQERSLAGLQAPRWWEADQVDVSP